MAELKKSYAEWDTKFKSRANTFAEERKKLSNQVAELLRKKVDLEQYVEEEIEKMNKKLEGMALKSERFLFT